MYVTQQGSDAIAKAQSQLGQITNMDISTQQGLAAQGKMLTEYALSLSRLDSIPGVSGSALKSLKTKLSEAQTKFRNEVLNLNAVRDMAAGRKPQRILSEEDLNKNMPRLIATADFLNTGSEDDARRFGIMINNIHNRRNAIPQAATDYISRGLTSNDPAKIKMAYGAISMFDPNHSGMFSSKIKNNKNALNVYLQVKAGEQPATIDMNNPNLVSALETVEQDLSTVLNGGNVVTTKKKETDQTNETGVLFGDSGFTQRYAGSRAKWFVRCWTVVQPAGKEPELSPSLQKSIKARLVL